MTNPDFLYANLVPILVPFLSAQVVFRYFCLQKILSI